MLTNLMKDQQRKLVRTIQEKPHKADPTIVSALALIDILDLLGDIRTPADLGDSQDS